MRKLFIIIILILPHSVTAQLQLYQEPILGLDSPVYHWGWRADWEQMNAPFPGRLAAPSDIANLRIASGSDTVDIILIADHSAGRLHWLRTPAQPAPRPLTYLKTYGDPFTIVGKFSEISCIAVSSTGPLFDPITDRIFVNDRLGNAIIKFRFNFNPSSPESDELIKESTFIGDSLFYPCELKYINLDPAHRQHNRLVSFDDIGNRLLIFSDGGDFLRQYDPHVPGDSLSPGFSFLTYKKENDGSLLFYLLNYTYTSINRFRLSSHGRLEYLNCLNIGDGANSAICDIIYDTQLGLLALDGAGHHIYRIADDLSQINDDIGSGLFSAGMVINPFKIRLFPERIVFIEEAGSETGIVSFVFNQSIAKQQPVSENLPYVFALSPNYPNPFNPTTTISFEIPEAGLVKVEIFNILGQRVKSLVSDYKAPGRYSVIWDGRNEAGQEVSSGVYFYRLQESERTDIRKMLLLK